MGRENGFLRMYLRRYDCKASKIRVEEDTNFQKCIIGITSWISTDHLDTHDLTSSEGSLVDIAIRAPVDLFGIEITLYSRELEAFWEDLSGPREKRQCM
jgi:hypothetical protein